MAVSNACCLGAGKGQKGRGGRAQDNWEANFGCCVAISLSVLELKRMLLLTLEVLADSRVIKFAGALVPVAFSFADSGIGFPVALAAVYIFRRNRVRKGCTSTRPVLLRFILVLVVCLVLNLVTVFLIGYHVNVHTEPLQDALKTSMMYYATRASHKSAIDELQLDLQCCGSTSYDDWFQINWQGSDSVDSEGRGEYDDQSVPFSCCRKYTLLSCCHLDIRKEDVKTVNSRGCAAILSGILYRVVLVGYAMTGLIVCTQIVAIVLLIRILKKIASEPCASSCSCCESGPSEEDGLNRSSDDCSTASDEQLTRKRRVVRKQLVCRRPPNPPRCTSSLLNCSSSSASSKHSSPTSNAQCTTSPDVSPELQIPPAAQQQLRLAEACDRRRPLYKKTKTSFGACK